MNCMGTNLCALSFLFTKSILPMASCMPMYFFLIYNVYLAHVICSNLLYYYRKGVGYISALGGDGLAGGGGGRVSIDIFSRHDSPKIYVNGQSYHFLFEYSILLVFGICLHIYGQLSWISDLYERIYYLCHWLFLPFPVLVTSIFLPLLFQIPAKSLFSIWWDVYLLSSWLLWDNYNSPIIVNLESCL